MREFKAMQDYCAVFFEDVELFESPPCFEDLVHRMVSIKYCRVDEISVRG